MGARALGARPCRPDWQATAAHRFYMTCCSENQKLFHHDNKRVVSDKKAAENFTPLSRAAAQQKLEAVKVGREQARAPLQALQMPVLGCMTKVSQWVCSSDQAPGCTLALRAPAVLPDPRLPRAIPGLTPARLPAALQKLQKEEENEDDKYVYLPPGSSMREPGDSMSDPGERKVYVRDPTPLRSPNKK